MKSDSSLGLHVDSNGAEAFEKVQNTLQNKACDFQKHFLKIEEIDFKIDSRRSQASYCL